jgi:hypothetical protein
MITVMSHTLATHSMAERFNLSMNCLYLKNHMSFGLIFCMLFNGENMRLSRLHDLTPPKRARLILHVCLSGHPLPVSGL